MCIFKLLPKVIYPKYSKHWPYTMAHTIDCVCSKILNHGLNHGIFLSLFLLIPTDNGHPERAFFQKFETFGLGQTNWAEILWGIWGISGQTISTILALWVPCSWESVAGSFFYKKIGF